MTYSEEADHNVGHMNCTIYRSSEGLGVENKERKRRDKGGWCDLVIDEYSILEVKWRGNEDDQSSLPVKEVEYD